MTAWEENEEAFLIVGLSKFGHKQNKWELIAKSGLLPRRNKSQIKSKAERMYKYHLLKIISLLRRANIAMDDFDVSRAIMNE